MELHAIEPYVTCGEYLAPHIVLSSAIWAVNWSVTRTTVSCFNGKLELALAFTSAINKEDSHRAPLQQQSIAPFESIRQPTNERFALPEVI